MHQGLKKWLVVTRDMHTYYQPDFRSFEQLKALKQFDTYIPVVGCMRRVSSYCGNDIFSLGMSMA